MCFFKKKKMIELDNKIDYLIEQLELQNQKIIELSDDIGNFSKRLEKVEINIKKELDKRAEFLKEEMSKNCTFLSEEQENVSEKLIEHYKDETQEIKMQISTEGKTCAKNYETLFDNILQRIDLLDSEVKLLLLNSVMDQIDEEK